MTSPALSVVFITFVSVAHVRFIKDKRVIRSNKTPVHDAWVDREKAMMDAVRLDQLWSEPTTS